jgi:class 3 adenylate cyclase
MIEAGARFVASDDFLPEARSKLDRVWELQLAATEEWGEGKLFALWAPSVKSAPGFWQTMGSAERICASPGMARAIMRAATLIDARQALPRISAPTLVLHREDSFIPVELGRHLAGEIEGSKLVVFPGDDHFIWVGAWEPIIDEIEQFLTGARGRSDPDRALTTVLFTDIVDSTARAAELGDARWRALLERHDEVTSRELQRYGGRMIKTLGDGALAAFEGPAKAIRCARAICGEVRALGIELRAGVHSGECELRGEDVAGIAVNVGARIGALARPSEILVSGTVRELVMGSGLEFAERGSHVLKGVPGDWRLCSVVGDGRMDARPVSEVDSETAALTPGPRETMRVRDRAMLTAAERAPRLMQTFGKVSLSRLRAKNRAG